LIAWHESNRQAGAKGVCAQLNLAAVVADLPGSWPTLNNSPPAGRDFADRVWLARGDGTVMDHVVLDPADGPPATPAAASWERLARRPANPETANWGYSTAWERLDPRLRQQPRRGRDHFGRPHPRADRIR
jgi:hypothetical protein